MAHKSDKPRSRRDFFKLAGGSAAAAAMLSGMGVSPALAQAIATGASEKPLKAAFSNAGLQATWCAQGKAAAEYWGKLFNVEVTWFDGQLDAVKQRAAIDNMASQQWDFVAIQAFGIGTLTAPVNKMIEAGIPVIGRRGKDRGRVEALEPELAHPGFPVPFLPFSDATTNCSNR